MPFSSVDDSRSPASTTSREIEMVGRSDKADCDRAFVVDRGNTRPAPSIALSDTPKRPKGAIKYYAVGSRGCLEQIAKVREDPQAGHVLTGSSRKFSNCGRI